MPSSPEVDALQAALKAPFAPEEVEWKPQAVSGGRALAIAYVDARVIMNRLDLVAGVAGWQDEYEFLPDGSALCRLSIRVGGEWVVKMDVGGPSDQPDAGDKRKSALSDALKRAAVKWGVGRYLYKLPAQWVDFDPQKKRLLKTPSLPPWALPAGSGGCPGEPPRAAAPRRVAEGPPAADAGTGLRASAAGASKLPADGAELALRVNDFEAKMTARGLCRPGQLAQHLVRLGLAQGYPSNLARYAGPQIAWAVEEVKKFKAQARAARADADWAPDLEKLGEQMGRAGWSWARCQEYLTGSALGQPEKGAMAGLSRPQYDALLAALAAPAAAAPA
jgi:Rad52/22 family double-strand break repair protein